MQQPDRGSRNWWSRAPASTPDQENPELILAQTRGEMNRAVAEFRAEFVGASEQRGSAEVKAVWDELRNAGVSVGRGLFIPAVIGWALCFLTSPLMPLYGDGWARVLPIGLLAAIVGIGWFRYLRQRRRLRQALATLPHPAQMELLASLQDDELEPRATRQIARLLLREGPARRLEPLPAAPAARGNEATPAE